MKNFKNNKSIIDTIKEKLSYFVFAFFMTLLMPYVKYRSYISKKYSCYRERDQEIEFYCPNSIHWVDRELPKTNEYIEFMNKIQAVYDKYDSMHQKLYPLQNKVKKCILLKHNENVDMFYHIPNFFGGYDTYNKKRPYGHALWIKSEFPWKKEIIEEMKPIFIEFGKFISNEQWTYFSQREDDFGNIAIGIWLLWDESLLNSGI